MAERDEQRTQEDAQRDTPPWANGLPGNHYAPELPRALWWDADKQALCLLDQSRLPECEEVITCTTAEQVAAAIRELRVRGAPAIGIAAAYGIGLAARTLPLAAREAGTPALAVLQDAATMLRATRPTAVNLGWAIDRMLACANRAANRGILKKLPAVLLDEARGIAGEDANACAAMGWYGARLLKDGDTVLTHCNAGALATGGMGTALAPIYTAHRDGKRIAVYAGETRPVLQGARLTAWELQRAGVPVTLIADNMAASVLARGIISVVFVGADRIAANGDTANKIGTYGLAVLALAHGVPFYVVAPRSSVDLALPDGTRIPIEQRPPGEVTHLAGVRIAPEGVRVENPAFDVTPARYITAIITEAGIAEPPFRESLRGGKSSTPNPSPVRGEGEPDPERHGVSPAGRTPSPMTPPHPRGEGSPRASGARGPGGEDPRSPAGRNVPPASPPHPRRERGPGGEDP